MKKYLEKIKSDILIRTILDLLLLLIVPFICVEVIYISSSLTLEKQKQESMQKNLEECVETLEKEVEEAYTLVELLSGNTQILQYLYQYGPEELSSVTKMINAQKTLNSLTLAFDKIVLIQIYANLSDTMIDQDNGRLYLERYYHSFNMEGMEYDEWHEFLKNSTKTYEILYDIEFAYAKKKHEAWVMSCQIPKYSSSQKYGQVFLYLDKEKILSDFSMLDYHNGGYFTVLSDEQKVILLDNESNLSEENIQSVIVGIKDEGKIKLLNQNGKNMLVIKKYSSDLKATIAMAVPKDYVYAPIKSIQFMLRGMWVLLITTGILLIIFIARKLTQPFIEMNQILNIESSSAEELIIKLNALLEHNKKLKDEIIQSIPALKTAALYNLLLTGFDTKIDMDRAINQIGINRQARQYGLLIIRLLNMENKKTVYEINMQQVFVGNFIKNEIEAVQAVFFPDYERILVLFATNEETKCFAEKKMDEILEKSIYPFLEKNQLKVLISGDIGTEISDFSGMFLRAQAVLDAYSLAEMENLKVLWYSQNKKKNLTYCYPLDIEKRLSNSIIMGRTGVLVETFDELKTANANLFEKHVDEEIMKLLYAIYATLCNKQEEYQLQDEKLENIKKEISENLSAGENLIQTFYLIEEAFYICVSLKGGTSQGEEKMDLSEKIRIYICQHYRDPQICLNSIAEHFSITESYLSRLYKQSFQTTCNKAIESLRMEDAALQLSQGKSVTIVAESVGYHSVQVFRRVYKKYYQESPSKSKEKAN